MHSTLKLIPGVDTTKTPALNEAAISSCNLIRFAVDRNGMGLPQKIGGWTNLFDGAISDYIIRSTLAWEDTNSTSRISCGTERELFVSSGNPITSTTDITPQEYEIDVPIKLTTTTGSSVVTIKDPGSKITTLDAVFVATQIAVGGLVIYGLYSCTPIDNDNYSIVARDILGNPKAATSNVTDGGAVPSFTTGAGSSSVNVNLADHGYLVGDTFPVFVSVSLGGSSRTDPVGTGGVTLFGNYTVIAVVDSDNFAIRASSLATTSETRRMNSYVFTTTAAAGTGATATLTFSDTYAITVGSSIDIYGVTPAGFNATNQAVTASAAVAGASTVSYVNATVGPQTVAGTIVTHGLARYNYYISGGILARGTGYGTGGYGSGGYGTGAALLTGRTFNLTNSVGDGTTATLTFTGKFEIPVGSSLIVAGATVAGFDSPSGQTWTVTASTASKQTSTVSFANTTVSASAASVGTVTIVRWQGLEFEDWTLDNWGEDLIVCPFETETSSGQSGGAIFRWSPTEGNTTCSVITEAPSINHGAIVAMPQRQIIAWGSTFNGFHDPLLIRWCDVNNYYSWIGDVTNQAGSYRIPKGSKIIQALQASQQTLVFTDTGLWSMQYVGQPYIYQFNELGTGCGLIGRKAAGTVSNITYWMGNSQFYRLAGEGIEPIPCPVWDIVFQTFQENNLTSADFDKIRFAANSMFGEVTWYFPTEAGGENTMYVKYNTLLNQWDYGALARTAWINTSVYGAPIGAGALNGGYTLYQHETSNDGNGEPISAEFTTGYFSLNDADFKVFVDEIWPDMKFGDYGASPNADVKITFYATDFPTQDPVTFGPYSLNTINQTRKYITTRIRTRLLAIKISSSDLNSFWRLGGIRYRSQADGRY
jgi:hypothetical protein